MRSGFEESQFGLNDDRVEQMLIQAERLSKANGGVLDDSAILAVAEATDSPVDYVRLAARLMAEKQKTSFASKLRSNFLMLEPEVRRYVLSGIFGTGIALLQMLEIRTGTVQSDVSLAPIFGTLKLILISVGIYNLAISRDRKTAAMCGAILCGVAFATFPVFAYFGHVANRIETIALISAVLGGAVGGVILHRIVDRFRNKLGLKDPVKERQDLLRQLYQLREKLNSGEQSMTFLSVDIVGSTRMKELSDPLSVEFTFTEYHGFVESVTKRYAGRVHSTAGDGVTCAFDHPQQAFGAARNLQAGMIELNTFRNKIGIPIRLRCGIHSGSVVAPDVDDVTSVNFAHVIDIAAHLQKVCPEGGVVVSEAAAMSLPGGLATVGVETVEVSGVAGVVWQPKRSLPTPSSPPPLPPAASQPTSEA